MASRALAAIALVCAVAAGAAGCGGSSSDGKDKEADVAAAFKQGYSAQRAPLNKVSDQIGETLTSADGKSDTQVESELRAVQGSYHAQLAKLGRLIPPDTLKADFAKVTTAAGVLDADLVAITKAAAAHDAAGAQAATEQLVSHAPALKAASATLGRKLGLKPSADADATTTTASDGGDEAGGKIHVVYDPPSDADAKSAKEILQLGGTDGIAEGLSHSFVLPQDMGIHVVDGFVGPNYDPQTKTITLSYGFVNYVAEQLTRSFPGLKKDQNELGREWAAVDGFVLLHEFGHALIDLYGLPVLGKEEDAADSVATVFLTRTVKNGAEYAFDAARFFNAMSARQRKLAPSAYWDEHSLDKQRAYAIVCWIAGSSDEDMATVRELGILDDARLQRCPSEYQQKVRSWDALLKPHVRG
ncbi:DUF4344 domain-containing metallopeptidase [Baekduia sp. Peel2402]|uniref:DUF4344 domain-containing metallopeptidase n=1 Tax=Baekduia sp. Peel2402 TaxID=3458296 RepID=UPI00403E4E26